MINIYFGNPGCGKTTFAVRKAYKIIKRYKKTKKTPYNRIYANFETKTMKFHDLDGLGEWSFPPKSLVCIDEAGIEYNSRKYKSMKQSLIRWFKLHRHFKCDVDFYSQSWEDMDVTIRRLADNLFHLRRLGPFTICRKVKKVVMVDEITHQIIDGYEFIKLINHFNPLSPHFKRTFSIFIRKPYYKYFDSYSVPDDVVIIK